MPELNTTEARLDRFASAVSSIAGAFGFLPVPPSSALFVLLLQLQAVASFAFSTSVPVSQRYIPLLGIQAFGFQ
jgi:hypothetical protein